MPARSTSVVWLEDARDLVKTRDVVLVLLDGVEGNGKRQIREAGMDAVLLVDRHLVLFEVVVGDALLEDTNHKVVRELVLVGEAGRWDGFEPRKERLVGLVALGNGARASGRPACRCSGSRRRRWHARESCGDRTRIALQRERSERRGDRQRA